MASKAHPHHTQTHAPVSHNNTSSFCLQRLTPAACSNHHSMKAWPCCPMHACIHVCMHASTLDQCTAPHKKWQQGRTPITCVHSARPMIRHDDGHRCKPLQHTAGQSAHPFTTSLVRPPHATTKSKGYPTCQHWPINLHTAPSWHHYILLQLKNWSTLLYNHACSPTDAPLLSHYLCQSQAWHPVQPHAN